MSHIPAAGDGLHQRCDHCGVVAPLADLDMQYAYGLGVQTECRDGAACKARRAARDWRPDIHAVVAELAALGITAEASEPMADDDFCSLYIDPRRYAHTDAVGMCVGWDADNGWTFFDWSDPPLGGDNTCYLDAVDPTDPSKVAERVKAILDGTVDEFRPVPPYNPTT